MPALSPTMESGTVTEWHKAPGDELSAGDVICDVETDKATVAFDVQDDGVLAKIISAASSPDDSTCPRHVRLTAGPRQRVSLMRMQLTEQR